MSFDRREITELFKSARRVLRHPIFDLLVAPKAQHNARILVTTPKRIGNAPARNKIRRQIKALFYEEKLFEQKYDCVVVVKNLEGITFDILKNLLKTALHTINSADVSALKS